MKKRKLLNRFSGWDACFQITQINSVTYLSGVGKTLEGKILTREEYFRIEKTI